MMKQEKEEEHRPFGFAQGRLKPVLLAGRAGWKRALPGTPGEPDDVEFVTEDCRQKRERSLRGALFCS